MAKTRHDFPVAVKKQLERRVNGKCSNPDHRVHTSGPKMGAKGANSMGIAAHITGAAPGGPRYDLNLTKMERGSIENAIWLCTNCSTIIDNDPDKYPVELLQEWKRTSERLAEAEYGQAPVAKNDYDALLGLAVGSLKKNVLPDAISRIGRLTKQEIEKLDPRFYVEVEYKNSQESFTFNAKEDVPFSINVSEGYADEFAQKMKSLVHHGEDLEIDSKGIVFSGSPIFQLHNEHEGKLSIMNLARKKGVVRISAANTASQNASSPCEIPGEIIIGQKSYTFNGSAFDGIIFLKFTHDMESGETINQEFGTNLDSWDNKPLNAIPYFERVFKVYEALNQSNSFTLDLEIEGLPLAHGKGSIDVKKYHVIIRHVRNARYLFAKLGMNGVFRLPTTFTADELNFAELVFHQMNVYDGLKGNQLGYVKVNLKALNDDFSEITQGIHAFKVEETMTPPAKMFGNDLRPLKISRIYTKTIAKIKSRKGTVKRDGTVALEMHPIEDCQVLTELQVT